jgi:NADH-quinone oxidoreductase subunit J
MTVADLAFYAFSTVTVAAALMVTLSRNPVHSVLWLILTFLSAAGLFVLLGAEFVAMLLIIVYVGAVAVLFLFVVMMLDVDFAELKSEMAKYMPIGLLVAVILLIQLAFGLGAWVSAEGAMGLHQAPTPDATQIDNTRALGLAGLILLVAMIGAIVLTLRHRRDIKRQNVLHQMWRDPAKALEMVDVKPGQGL